VHSRIDWFMNEAPFQHEKFSIKHQWAWHRCRLWVGVQRTSGLMK
jgi:hypothetical protein